MATSKTPSKTPAKSNVARSSSLKKGSKFDIRIIAILGILLVAIVGYLFIRFSKAGTLEQINADKFKINNGTLTTGSDGKPAVKSITAVGGTYAADLGDREYLDITATTANSAAAKICFEGTAPAGAKAWSGAFYVVPNTGGKGGWAPPSESLPTGTFSYCRNSMPTIPVSGGYRVAFGWFSSPKGTSISVSRVTVTQLDTSQPKYTWLGSELNFGAPNTLSGTSLMVKAGPPDNYTTFSFDDPYNKVAGKYCIETSGAAGGPTTTLRWSPTPVYSTPQEGNCVTVGALPSTQAYRGFWLEYKNGNMQLTKITFTPTGGIPSSTVPPSLPPTTNTPVVTTPPTTSTSTSTSTDPVPQNATKVKQ